MAYDTLCGLLISEICKARFFAEFFLNDSEKCYFCILYKKINKKKIRILK